MLIRNKQPVIIRVLIQVYRVLPSLHKCKKSIVIYAFINHLIYYTASIYKAKTTRFRSNNPLANTNNNKTSRVSNLFRDSSIGRVLITSSSETARLFCINTPMSHWFETKHKLEMKVLAVLVLVLALSQVKHFVIFSKKLSIHKINFEFYSFKAAVLPQFKGWLPRSVLYPRAPVAQGRGYQVPAKMVPDHDTKGKTKIQIQIFSF